MHYLYLHITHTSTVKCPTCKERFGYVTINLSGHTQKCLGMPDGHPSNSESRHSEDIIYAKKP